MVCTAGEYAKLETQYEMEVSADDPELVEKLDRAAEEGELVDFKQKKILWYLMIFEYGDAIDLVTNLV